MSWQIISAIALIILAIVAIIKKVETRMTLLLAGFAMCVLAGHPMAAFQSLLKAWSTSTWSRRSALQWVLRLP